MSYRCVNSVPIARGLYYSDKSGQKIVVPRYQLTFLNEETGELHTTNDLSIKQSKKRKKFYLFNGVYRPYLKKGQVSILLFVTEKEYWQKQSKFISYIKKKIKRLGGAVLGYMWANDIGVAKFKDHVHTVIATDRLTSEQIRKIITKKCKYSVQCCNDIRDFVGYLNKKNLYAENKKRSWGCSRKFFEPKTI